MKGRRVTPATVFARARLLMLFALLVSACAPALVVEAKAPSPPTNTSAPSISDTTPHESDTLTAYPGGWTGTGPIAFAYQWMSCDAAGGGCTSITGATTNMLSVGATLVGSTLRTRVVATNAAGSATAYSATTDVVGPTKPAAVTLPVVTGAAVYQSAVTASPGTWTGTAPISLGYRWKRCDATGTTCTSITGATSPTYIVALADAGSALRIAVTATNAAGSTAATSAATAAVPLVAPFVTSSPTISDTTPHDGDRLTAYSGSWTGTVPITFGYQWQRCAADGTACANLTGAIGSTYDVTPADAGTTIAVLVIAANGAGSTAASSAPTSLVDAAAPVKRNPLPAITGTAAVGATLTGTSGSWSGSQPITYAYRWKRCDALGGSCLSINGATASTYAVDLADVGNTLRLSVTATNAGGSASAASSPTALIAPVLPANQVVPTISDSTPHDLDALTAYPGSWWGTQPMSFSYEWDRCDAGSVACTPIAGATGASYAVEAGDIASTIRVTVTATNAAGATNASSTATAVVDPATPVSALAPSISGPAIDGSTLTADPGGWTGTAPIAFSYRWMRCNSGGGACLTVLGQTASNYALDSADVNATIRVAVTATNAGGTASTTAAATPVVAGIAPFAITPPTLTGRAVVGLALSALGGAWGGSTPMTVSTQWLRCDAFGSSCVSIAGESSPNLTLTAADAGHAIRVRSIGNNMAGTGTIESAFTPPVAIAPAATFADGFTRSDGIITNEYAFYNPTHPDAIFSPDWEMTSGSLFARSNQGWSGVVDDQTPDATSSNGTNSAIFRLRTLRNDFLNTSVSLALRIDGLGSTPRTPATAYDGVHLWVRYTSETSLYAVSVARRDGTVRVKKKCPGGPSNGGVYYDLVPSLTRPLALGQWATFSVSAFNETDGSVTLEVYRDSMLVRRVSDPGVGCAPIVNAGRIGVRGDNAEFDFDNVVVRSY